MYTAARSCIIHIISELEKSVVSLLTKPDSKSGLWSRIPTPKTTGMQGLNFETSKVNFYVNSLILVIQIQT